MSDELTTIRRYVKAARGAIESGQVTDKDVHGTLTKVLEMLDALAQQALAATRNSLAMTTDEHVTDHPGHWSDGGKVWEGRPAVGGDYQHGYADGIEWATVHGSATSAVGGEAVAWLYEMAFYIKPSADPALKDWKQVVTLDPPPTIPKDGVRNVSPLYAAQPSSPLPAVGGEAVNDMVSKIVYQMSPADQYDLAFKVAENIGYMLVREPEHPDSPHLAAQPASPLRGRDSEFIARTIALSYGRTPDDMTSVGEMCDGDNRPVPIWMVYEEQADAVLTACASPPEQPAADNVKTLLETIDAKNARIGELEEALAKAVLSPNKENP